MADVKAFFAKFFGIADHLLPALQMVPGVGMVATAIHMAENIFGSISKSGQSKLQFVDNVSVNGIVLYAAARGVPINDPSVLSAKVKAVSDASVDLEHYLGSLGIPGFGFLHSS